MLVRAAGGLGPAVALAALAACSPGSSPGKGGGPPVKWGEPVQVDSGAAVVGPWRMNESDWRYVDDPTVALGEGGAAAVAWVDQSRKDVLFQRFGPGGEPQLGGPVNVSGSPEVFSWLPRVALAPGGAEEVYLLWQEILFTGGSHGGEILFARSADGGRTFSEPLNLSNSPEGDGKGRLTPRLWHNGSLDLALGPDGDVYAAWTEYEGRLWFRRSTDGGESFAEPIEVAGEGGRPARGPSLAAGADGAVYLAWTVGHDPGADVRFARSTDGGRSFGEPRVVSESGGHADAPKLAAGGEGTVHLAYGESPSGALRAYHVRYARSTDRGRSFGKARAVVRPGDRGVESLNFPGLAPGGEGEVYLLWHRFPEERGRPRGLGLARSADGGRTFGPPSVVPGTADPALGFTGSQQGLLMKKLSANGAGEVAVVNSTFREGESSRVRLVRGRTPGGPGDGDASPPGRQ